MSIRDQVLTLIGQLSDEQLSALLPVILALQGNGKEEFSSETAQAYQDWLSSENDLYDELFSDEVAAR